MKKMDLSVVLPAYNEAANITPVIADIYRLLPPFFENFEVIVVNDGSTDATQSRLHELQNRYAGVHVIQHFRNRGYGAALRSGFERARYDWVFFTDADQQFDIAEIQYLLPWIEQYDIVSGYRRNRADSGLRKLNAGLWNALVYLLFRIQARDIDCAFKLFRKSALRRLQLSADGAMINTEILALAQKQELRFYEIPVSHFPRQAGKQSGANIRVIVKAFMELFKMYRRLK